MINTNKFSNQTCLCCSLTKESIDSSNWSILTSKACTSCLSFSLLVIIAGLDNISKEISSWRSGQFACSGLISLNYKNC